jgi:anaerobic C4-dicarboxylate transporter DcuA
VLLGSFPQLLPSFAGKETFVPNFAVNKAGQVQMPSMIMMIILAATALIILFAKTTASQVTKASLFSSAGSETIAVFERWRLGWIAHTQIARLLNPLTVYTHNRMSVH